MARSLRRRAESPSNSERMTFDVFGRYVLVQRENERWAVFYTGVDGKKRTAQDIVIPAVLAAGEVEGYLGDLCHEWATAIQPNVRRIS